MSRPTCDKFPLLRRVWRLRIGHLKNCVESIFGHHRTDSAFITLKKVKMLPWFLTILAISSMTLAALPQSPETGFCQIDLNSTNEQQRLFNEWPISEFHEEIFHSIPFHSNQFKTTFYPPPPQSPETRLHSHSCEVKTSFGPDIPSIEQSKTGVFLTVI